MPFLTPLALAYTGRGRYVTTAPLRYEGGWDVLTVPTGFGTDLASVPRVFWSWLPPHGEYERAAVVHDWAIDELVITPADADGLFRRIMREEGVSTVRRWLMWTAVRWAALTDPARRAGWLRDAPAVLAITAAVLVAVVAALGGLAWAVCEVAR